MNKNKWETVWNEQDESQKLSKYFDVYVFDNFWDSFYNEPSNKDKLSTIYEESENVHGSNQEYNSDSDETYVQQYIYNRNIDTYKENNIGTLSDDQYSQEDKNQHSQEDKNQHFQEIENMNEISKKATEINKNLIYLKKELKNKNFIDKPPHIPISNENFKHRNFQDEDCMFKNRVEPNYNKSNFYDNNVPFEKSKKYNESIFSIKSKIPETFYQKEIFQDITMSEYTDDQI